LDKILSAMKDVVNTPQGTGVNCKMKDGTAAGKTGTAENPHGEPHSWFASFYPYENPQLVVIVIVENGGHGSEAACNITKKIYEKCIQEHLCR